METEEKQPIENTAPVKEKHKMKKGWKITWISLASVVGLLVVSVLVLMWLVLTPARLTSIVNKLSDKYLLCETQFDNVDLTIIKTFPYVGLKVEGVAVINPMEGAVSDTVAHVKELCVGINLREYLKNKNIVVTKLLLDQTTANLYTNREGASNFDIFPASETPDTTSEPFQMPDLVSLKSIRVKRLNATYVDDQSQLKACLKETDLAVDGHYTPQGIDAKVDMLIDRVNFALSGDSSHVEADLQDFSLQVDGDQKARSVDGNVKLVVNQGKLALNDMQYVNDAVSARQGDLIRLEGRVMADLLSRHIQVEEMKAVLKDYAVSLDGAVELPSDTKPMTLDMRFATNAWNVDTLLAMLPAEFTSWRRTMQLDADATVTGTVAGPLGDSLLPKVTANLKLSDGRFYDKTIVPYAFSNINADISADLNLNSGEVSSVQVTKLSAFSGRNYLEVSGKVDDLLDKMYTDAQVKGNIYLADAKAMMPSDLNMRLGGRAQLNLHAKTNMDQLQRSDFKNMQMTGQIGLKDIDVAYDTIFAQIPDAIINVNLPTAMKKGLFDELLSATIDCSNISAQLPNQVIDGSLGKTKLKVAISDVFDSDQPFRVVCDFDFASLNGTMDSLQAQITHPQGLFAMMPVDKKGERVKYKIEMTSEALHCKVSDSMKVDLAGLTVKGGANYDPSKSNALQQWSPNLDVDFKRGYIDMAQVDYLVQIPDIKFNYKPERCEISSANVVFGNSDIYLSGAVTGLEKWLSHEAMLKGDLYLTSNYTNVDDLLEVFSGMGTDEDTLAKQREEDKVDTSAHPFIVPKDVDFTLHTRIKEATAFENDLREVAGDVRIRDGVAVLNQVGFVCKAARMQLTGMYKTPRVNHIFVGMDFHLLDINIQELIDMIPYVDTLVPLLNDLEGAADFHLCAETYVNAFYKPKMSTLRAAAALTGQDLVVLDNKDIDKIAKLLKLKDWRDGDSKMRVDSLDVAMTVFRNELEVYPFLLSLHKYQIVAEGRHNLDNNYDYHVELVETPLPVRLAVDVYGTMPKLKFDLSPKLRYKNLYRPAKRSEVDNEVLRLKSMIRQSLEANVKEETRTYEGLGAE